MPHLVIATELTEAALASLRAESDITVSTVPPRSEALREPIAEADALIVRNDLQVDADLLERATRLRLIASMSADLSGIDLAAATARGILVMNTPGLNAVAAGEHTLALMLALSRHLVTAHNSLKEGYWLLDRKRQAGTQLDGKTVGLIGLGRVGQVVALRCLSFNMTVLAYDPYLHEDQRPDQRVQLVGLRELLERSDFVSLHVPGTPEARHLLDADALHAMKAGARLINTAHGSLIDESALVTALQEGHLAGAAVDVYANEPPYNSPLVGLTNVIHTPHIGDNTEEARQDLSMSVARQVLDALRDVDYRNVVNLPVMPGLDYDQIRPYMHLAEAMGRILHALARHPVRRVAIETSGEEVQPFIKPMTVGLLRGLLAPVLGNQVNAVNAPLLATERGWHITQVKGLNSGEYANVLLCQVTLTDGELITISGILLDRREAHIVQINEYRMNFVPQGHMLLMGSHDRPGVIGRVGTLLANHEINIASWHTGRAAPGGQTLTVINLDAALPDHILEELSGLDFVRHVHQVHVS